MPALTRGASIRDDGLVPRGSEGSFPFGFAHHDGTFAEGAANGAVLVWLARPCTEDERAKIGALIATVAGRPIWPFPFVAESVQSPARWKQRGAPDAAALERVARSLHALVPLALFVGPALRASKTKSAWDAWTDAREAEAWALFATLAASRPSEASALRAFLETFGAYVFFRPTLRNWQRTLKASAKAHGTEVAELVDAARGALGPGDVAHVDLLGRLAWHLPSALAPADLVARGTEALLAALAARGETPPPDSAEAFLADRLAAATKKARIPLDPAIARFSGAYAQLAREALDDVRSDHPDVAPTRRPR